MISGLGLVDVSRGRESLAAALSTIQVSILRIKKRTSGPRVGQMYWNKSTRSGMHTISQTLGRAGVLGACSFIGK